MLKAKKFGSTIYFFCKESFYFKVSNKMVKGGECLCKWRSWNSEYFLQVPFSMIRDYNFVATFWLVSNPKTWKTYLFVVFFSLFIKLLYYFLYIVLVFIFRANFYQLENNFQTNWYYRYLYEVRGAPVLPAVNIKNKIGKINQIVQTITNLLVVMSYSTVILSRFTSKLENSWKIV